ncbi:RmlC-like cupin domain-containing protein [Coniochaeta sp. 2T2.1]|nr:RmlC-like cupin domain-containing protein [Coniochaeta sp. 2T2.1]
MSKFLVTKTLHAGPWYTKSSLSRPQLLLLLNPTPNLHLRLPYHHPLRLTLPMDLTPLPSLRVSKHHIPPYLLLPNSSGTNKPLLIYHSAFHPLSSVSPEAVEAHLRSVGVVVPQWLYTMYNTTHFHSTTHEVLVVVSGKAKLCFGGEDNPERVEVTVGGGDVVVIPAGVGHRLLEDLSSSREGEEGEEEEFEMVGSYPKGKQWDMCYGREGEEEKVKGIAGVEWFGGDPVYGDRGPVLDV